MTSLPPPSSPSTLPMTALADAGGDADPLAVDVAAEDRAGAVRAVAVRVVVAFAGEVPPHELDALERRVVRVDAGVEDRDRDAVAGER